MNLPQLMIRRTIALAAALTALATLSADRPNILFIYTDDQSDRTISSYERAPSWVETPNIDRLAASGVRFKHAYNGTWCMPARATFLTGKHQYGVESMRMEGAYPGSAYDPEKDSFLDAFVQSGGIHHSPYWKVAYGSRHRIWERLGPPNRLEPP